MGADPLPTYSCVDIVKHNQKERSQGGISRWLVIGPYVYDVGEFRYSHPGGAYTLEHFTEDEALPNATTAFMNTHGSAWRILRKYSNDLRVGRYSGPTSDQTNQELQEKQVADEAQKKPHPRVAPGCVQQVGILACGFAWDMAGVAVQGAYNSFMAPVEKFKKKFFPVYGFPVNEDGSPTKVAIIGSGASGLSAAWCLHQTEGFDFTVFEKQDHVGGHAKTVPWKFSETETVPIEMGFIFGNYRSYSNLLEVMERVGTEPAETELSVSANVDGQKWCTSAEELGSGMRGPCVMDPEGHRECTRFHELADHYWENAAFNVVPFGTVLGAFGFAKEWRKIYLDPMLILLFLDTSTSYNMSARFMFNVFGGKNKFVDLRRAHRCFTVKQGTVETWKRIMAFFPERVRIGCGVERVRRLKDVNGKPIVAIETTAGETLEFDHVVFCCGAKGAEAMLGEEKSSFERFLFKMIRYNSEKMILHNDPSFLNADGIDGCKYVRHFNFRSGNGQARPQLSGSMLHALGSPHCQVNSAGEPVLQNIPILTADPCRPIAKSATMYEEWWGAVHVQDLRHLIATRLLLPSMQGSGNIWYGGSWCNWMGHSGAIDAGMAVATRLGAVYPLKNELSRTEFFNMACADMFGPNFDWETAVRKHHPTPPCTARASNPQEAESPKP